MEKKKDAVELPTQQPVLIERRHALSWIGSVVGSVALLGCGSSSSASGGGDAGDSGSAGGDSGSVSEGDASASTCHTIADETSGPYPDTKGMISSSTYNRSDITEGLAGTPLTLILTVVDTSNGCAAIQNANIEIWHCDKDGVYSEYASSTNAGSTSATYLRGVQTTNSAGQVTFKTIYPGWYNPRATHIHIQAYSGTSLKKTTQIGFPDATNTTVYAQSSLYTKGQNSTTNDTDQVFGGTTTATGNSDGGGHDYQIASIAGDTTNGFVASIVIGIAGFS